MTKELTWIKGSVWLAPMAGVTDLPFRVLCRGYGCDAALTEMVSARAYISVADTRRSVRQLYETTPGERVGMQLFGRDPAVIAEAARRVTDAAGGPFAFIDINMGCPAPKITGNGDGSALMRDIPLAARIVAETVKASRLPVTVKCRAGWDSSSVNAVELARAVQNEGASAITVHGRTREQQYSGFADLSVIARVKAAVRIPVIGNGDVSGGPSALRMLRETGCDAVMVGRAALGNPFIFDEVGRALRGLPSQPVPCSARVSFALAHARMMAAYKGERVAVREMRKHAAWAVRGMPGAAALRARLNEAVTLGELCRALEEGGVVR